LPREVKVGGLEGVLEKMLYKFLGEGLVSVEAMLPSKVDSAVILGLPVAAVVAGVVKTSSMISLEAASTPVPTTVPSKDLVPVVTEAGLTMHPSIVALVLPLLIAELASVVALEVVSRTLFPPAVWPVPLAAMVVPSGGSIPAVITSGEVFSGRAPEARTSDGVTVLSTVSVKQSSVLFVRAFKQELERVRAEDALVADRRELGALREGRVVMVGECKQGEKLGDKGEFFTRMSRLSW